MKTKCLSVAIALILLLAIPLTGCASRATIAQEGTSRPLPVYEPGPFPHREIKSGTTSPIAQLTLQNTDTKSGQFTVRIHFYALDKFTGDSQKETLDLPSQRLLIDTGEKYTYEQAINLAPGAAQTVSFAVPEIDMFEYYWFWRYEIVPPVKPSTEGKDYRQDPVLDEINLSKVSED
ncbi:hypothetical protein ES708_25006 [subsurface metagenome]